MPLPGVDPEDYPKIAERLGLTSSWVYDLAECPEDVRMTLSVSQAIELARIVGLSLAETLGVEMPESVEVIQPEEFRIRLQNAIEESACSLEEFEDRIGWELGKALATPERLLEIYNWDGLADVADAVEVSPWSLIPPASTQASKSD